MDNKIRCANPNCWHLFFPNPRVKDQKYCGTKSCQRVRKRIWQRQKMKNDPDYRDNQHDSQQSWIERNRDYWCRYREQHPEYVKRNCLLQKNRDSKRRRNNLAKMDASRKKYFVKPGRYYLIPVSTDLAKMDALLHEVLLIPDGYKDLAKKDSIDFPSFSA